MKDFFKKNATIIIGLVIVAIIAVGAYFMYFKKDTNKVGDNNGGGSGSGNGGGSNPANADPLIQSWINRILQSDDSGGWKAWRMSWGDTNAYAGYPTVINDGFKDFIFKNAVANTPSKVIKGKFSDYSYATSDTPASVNTKAAKASKFKITPEMIQAAVQLASTLIQTSA